MGDVTSVGVALPTVGIPGLWQFPSNRNGIRGRVRRLGVVLRTKVQGVVGTHEVLTVEPSARYYSDGLSGGY